jgi:hypothetical protein
VNPTPITDTIKAELAAAFAASGLTNAEFARRAQVSEPMALRLRDPFESNHVDTLARALAALGKRLEVRVVDVLAAVLVAIIALLPFAAIAQAPTGPQPCPVIAHAVIHTYDGPIDIDQLCMSVTRHTGNRLEFEAIDMGAGIFRDGFDEVFPQ